uniref:ELYS-like domain-containing protein n=1 Tax=Anopheles culicifacies TaxID=139723 RepID=A0A182MUR6_9DIPT
MSSDISLELVNVLQYTREQSTAGTAESSDREEKCGVLEKNAITWYARGSMLEVFNMNSSFKVISQNFHPCSSKSKPCTVECVEEIDAVGCAILAVGLRLGAEQSQIVFLTVRGCREVGRIDIQENVNLLRAVDPNSCSNGLLNKYRGCLAAGTEDGKVILIDLCFKRSQNGFGQEITMNDPSKRQCHIEFSRGNAKQLIQNHEKIQERELYFGLQLSHSEQASVECILDIVPLKVICIGFADGTVLLWDLVDHSIMHRISAPTEECSAVALNYVEPSDDPKACLYLWIFYAHPEGAFAFLHMIMCEEKYSQQGTFVYDQFLSCSSRLNLTSYDPGSVPLNVQTVTKKVFEEDEPITLSVLSWIGSNGMTTVLVFDLNQWYKAEMPYECDWQQELTHTVVFQLKGESFHARLNERSLVLFRSIQRPEEHFYPSSLAFDILNFDGINCSTYRWIGLQNKLLQYLEQDGANSVIHPAGLYGMLCRAALLPQFHEPISPSDGIVKEQREFVLSLGLEYNCHMFLQSCIDLWADGSHLGAEPHQGVSLSTITDWIWNRSKALKSVCNRMLAALMTDQAGRRVDTRTQDALSHCTRQMKQLAELYRTIMTDCLEFIPENVQGRLMKESATITAAAEYQDILQWLLHVGILPEANTSDEEMESDCVLLVPYPYTRLLEFYRKRRRMLDEQKSKAVPDLSTSGKLLFIDNYLEREFDLESVWKVWHEDSPINRQAVYPPSSLQKALRILLIPDVPLERKLVLLLYLFMDVVAAVEDARFENVVRQLEKFPRMFNVQIGMMERVRAFWHLDHGNVSETVNEFLSPLSTTIEFPQWHRELMVSVLLRLQAPNLALKVLRAPGSPVSPQLELTTLVQNNLISEAFNLQRRTPQPDGRQLVWFIEAILMAGTPETLLEFSLNDEEKHVLRSYLRDCPLEKSESLMLGHLLQNFEFVEAVLFVDRLSRKRNVEVQKDILGLYHNALDPMSQQLAYLTYQHPNELEPKLGQGKDSGNTNSSDRLETLSSGLIRHRADFRVRVLHQSIAAVKEAAIKTGLHHDRPFLDKPSLGVFQCRPTVRSFNVSYPVRLDPSMNKRRKRDWDVSDEDLAKGQVPSTPLLNEEDGFGNLRKKRYLGPEYNTAANKIPVRNKFANFEVPVPVIPEFRPMKPKFNFTAANSTLISSMEKTARSEKSTSHSPSIFLTTPPFAKKQLQRDVQNRSDLVDPEEAHDDSYTPPGILKSSQSLHGRNSSPILHDHAAAEVEEKVLRFDLPAGSTLEDSCLIDNPSQPTNEEVVTDVAASDVDTPIVRRDLDLSTISNDDFYSPEVTMEQNSLQQVLASGGPYARRSIHSSRSHTPNADLPVDGGNNIAIIIEDHCEDDSSSKVDAYEQRQQEEEDMKMEVDEGNAPSNENVFVIDDSDGEQINSNEEELAASTNRDEIVILDDLSNQREQLTVQEKQFMETFADKVETNRYALVVESQPGQQHTRDDAIVDVTESIDDEEEEKLDEEVEHEEYDEVYEESEEDGEDIYDESVADEEDEQHEESSDNQDGVDGDEDEDSVLEVIDLSDEEEAVRPNHDDIEQPEEFVFSSSESSSSSSSDGDDMHPPAAASMNVADQVEIASEDVGAGGSPQGWRYGELHSDSNVENLYENVLELDRVDEEQHQEEVPDDALGYIQVPTTSSSTHRTEGEGLTGTTGGDGEAESSEVEDLSIAQQEPDVASDAVAARDLSVAGSEQWADNVASSSSSLSAAVSTVNASAPVASVAPSATTSTSPASQTAASQEKVFGQPKNAHELEVPAMNLSVKPDEAHGSSRKNSKGEENGLTEDARALNLSAGQQELADQGVGAEDENVSSNQEEENEDKREEKSEDEEANVPARDVQEAQSSDEIKTEAVESEEMDVDLRVSDDEATNESPVKQSPKQKDEDRADSGVTDPVDLLGATPTDRNEESNEEATPQGDNLKQGSKTAQQYVSRHDEAEASTSTPRTNVKTRLMAALEKSATAVEPPHTPTRRRNIRATSVVAETTSSSFSPMLSRSKRFTSADNLSGTPEPMQPLTPRRSTRASSMVKDIISESGTPQKRSRRTSQASNEPEHHPEPIMISPIQESVDDQQEPSEKSFASSTASSTRRSMRIRKLPKALQPPEATAPPSSDTQPNTAPMLSEYSSNRRLTRHQLAVLEKSMETIGSSSAAQRRVSMDRRSQDVADVGGDSESESVISNVSNQSSVRTTRSRTSRTAATRSKRASSTKLNDPADDQHVDSDSDQSLVYASSQRSVVGLEPIAEEIENVTVPLGDRTLLAHPDLFRHLVNQSEIVTNEHQATLEIVNGFR